MFQWKPYVPVAQRRRQAENEMRKLQKKGHPVSPVVVSGRTIANNFWGKAWCDNLERYSDYENRLPRGRTYVRNGSVVDLQMSAGSIDARVSGSELYRVKITVSAMPADRWRAICRDCAGSIDSLVELLQGKLSKGVMERIYERDSGLFPQPKEMKFSCSCPDWASMCKHVAAVLYGVGARLDHEPSLIFKLRNVDEKALIASVGKDVPLSKQAADSSKILADDGLFELFGLEQAAEEDAPSPAPVASTVPSVRSKRSATPSAKKAAKPKSSRSKARSKPLPAPTQVPCDTPITSTARRPRTRKKETVE